MSALPATGSLLLLCSSALPIGCLGALLAVDLLSWRRTRSLRRGRVPPGAARSGDHMRVRTSSVTLLPGWAGLACLAVAGLSLAVRSPVGPIASIALAAGGAFVATSGYRSRVNTIEATPDRIVVGYAHRPAVALRWVDCHSVRPPRTLLGGWRLSRAFTLMPSDLWGHEDVLVRVVERTGLAFDGRSWADGSGRVSPRP